MVVEALALFLGAHPGLCSGLLASTGASEQFAEVMRVNGEFVVGPLSRVVGAMIAETGGSAVPESAVDATNALMGGLLLGVLGRWLSGGDPQYGAFRRQLVRQMIHGLTRQSG